MKESVLVIAAHPDDEVLGCGGTIAKHVKNGDRVHVVIVAEGATSRQVVRSRETASDDLKKLNEAAKRAADILGVHELAMLGLPDNRLDSIQLLDLIKVLEPYFHNWNPSIVYTHHSGDVNIDHRLIHDAVVTICRPLPGQPVKRLVSFEVASSTDWQVAGAYPTFHPQWFEDISEEWERKSAALKAYDEEMRPWPHSRSHEAVENLARYRGAQVGFEAAEAFMLLRQLN